MSYIYGKRSGSISFLICTKSLNAVDHPKSTTTKNLIIDPALHTN